MSQDITQRVQLGAAKLLLLLLVYQLAQEWVEGYWVE